MSTNRCVDIVVGGQSGSEAKGKLISIIADKYSALVRTGGSNAAHTIYYKHNPIAFFMIPCGALHSPNAKLVLGAGAQIDLEHLKKEIGILKEHDLWLDSDGKPRLVIDPHATIVDEVDRIAENGGRMPDCGELYHRPRDCEIHNDQFLLKMGVKRDSNNFDKEAGTCVGCPKLPQDSAWLKLGSTTHGCGANSIRKTTRGTKMAILAGQAPDESWFFNQIASLLSEVSGQESKFLSDKHLAMELLRSKFLSRWSENIKAIPVTLAKDNEFTKQFLGDTVSLLNRMIDKEESIMLEGTQGSILSLHHGYPGKTTSRDTNASNWCMEAGISPLAVRDVYTVFRTFPIRVAGDSGPMSGDEINWEDVTAHAESPVPIVEITTATKRKRRVFTFGAADFQKALDINRPTVLVLTFVDYLSHEDRNKSEWSDLSQKTRDWITILESKHNVHFKYLSTGPDVAHTIER